MNARESTDSGANLRIRAADLDASCRRVALRSCQFPASTNRACPRPFFEAQPIACRLNRDPGEERSLGGSRHLETPRHGFVDSDEANTSSRRSAPLGARLLPSGSPYGDTDCSNPTREAVSEPPRLASARRPGDGRRRPGTRGCSSRGEYGYRRPPRARRLRAVRPFTRFRRLVSRAGFDAAHASPRSIRERCGSSSVHS